jgi:hypothetical protein
MDPKRDFFRIRSAPVKRPQATEVVEVMKVHVEALRMTIEAPV